MILEDALKSLIVARFGTVKQFSAACDLPYGTVDTILRRGINKASITNVIKMCKTLGISTDELADGRITPTDCENEKETDIIEAITISKMNAKNLTLDGVRLSPSEIETIYNSLDIGIELVRRGR